MSPYSLDRPVFRRTEIFEIKYRATKMMYITFFNSTYYVTSRIKPSFSKKKKILLLSSNKRERTLWSML